MIIRTEEFKYKLTVEELADEFCTMDSYNQAEFFDRVNSIMSNWGEGYGHQLLAISEYVENSGKKFIQNMFEYIQDK